MFEYSPFCVGLPASFPSRVGGASTGFGCSGLVCPAISGLRQVPPASARGSGQISHGEHGWVNPSNLASADHRGAEPPGAHALRPGSAPGAPPALLTSAGGDRSRSFVDAR